MTADESRDIVVRNQCDAAQLSPLPNPNEAPVSLLLAFVVITAAKSEVGITASFGETEKLRVGLRRSIRAFASRSSCCYRMPTGFSYF